MQKSKFFYIFSLILILSCLIFPLNMDAASVKLNKETATIRVGKSVKLKILNYGGKKKVTWKSSDSKIAIVDNGKVTGKKAGNVTITAKLGSKKYKCKIKVKNKPSLSKKSVTIRKGKSVTITVNDPGKNTTWMTNNNKVATVKNGTITAVAKGEATISVSTGSYLLTCNVTVIPKPKIVGKKTISINELAHFSVSNWSGGVTWKSDDDSIATISNKGIVTGKKAGSTKIRVVAGEYKLSYPVEVKNPSISTSSVTLQLYKTANLVVNNGAKLTWSSDNTNICSVSHGTVTANAVGGTTVTAKSSTHTFKFKVNVTYLTPTAENYIIAQKAYCDGYKKYGKYFIYSYPKAESSWKKALDKLRHKKTTGTTCVVPARWGLKDLGLSYSGFWVKDGKFQRSSSNEYTLKTKGGPIGYTIKEAVKKGKLKKGDVIAFRNRTHTVVYSGDDTYVYEGGSTPLRLGFTKIGTKVDYSKYTYRNMKINQIMRWKK